MPGAMVLCNWDVEHGACAMLHHTLSGLACRLAMLDSDDTYDWMPAEFIRNNLGRTHLDYPLRNRREQSA